MTLDDWLIKYNATARQIGKAFYIYHVPFLVTNDNANQLWELYHLDDYLISSLAGGSYCLIPR